jgi:hypothetical protein
MYLLSCNRKMCCNTIKNVDLLRHAMRMKILFVYHVCHMLVMDEKDYGKNKKSWMMCLTCIIINIATYV